LKAVNGTGKRAKLKPAYHPLYKDTPLLYKKLELESNDLSSMRASRDYVDGMCLAEGHDLALPYEQHDRRLVFKLSHKVSEDATIDSARRQRPLLLRLWMR